MNVTVIGAGLAGCEAAWQAANRGMQVTLYEMKPCRMSPAHRSPLFAELVCSNSLRSNRLQNAVGLLKEEMRLMHSLIMEAADAASVPAGGALAVDRERFSGYITQHIQNHPGIRVVHAEADALPEDYSIVAAGPLASDALTEAILRMPGAGSLHFYDAAAPIVTGESLNMEVVFRASRYGRGEDYLNCPMNREEYQRFVEALVSAETAPVHGFEEKAVFEGCMPVESMARRGLQTLAFGPLKPVGLPDPRTGREPYVVVQLRQDDAASTLYNLVGFQTRLKFGEQKRVFGLIPGLENAEFARYGVMHRNTFLQSPGFLNHRFQVINQPRLFFAGQITGVEGYVESAASGLAAGIHLSRLARGLAPLELPPETAIGALGRYVAAPNSRFQPMNITFGLMAPLDRRVRKKEERYTAISERALACIRHLLPQIEQ